MVDDHTESLIRTIRFHPAVSSVELITRLLSGGAIEVQFDMNVELPQAYKSEGVSPTGVKSREAIWMDFPANYPMRAPKVWLRKDFPRNHPHINPGSADTRVNPCLDEVNLDEVLHEGEGLNEILDQLSHWLSNAASGSLMSDSQGWEPVRRDLLPGVVSVDLVKLRKVISEYAGAAFFYFVYMRTASFGELYGWIDSQHHFLNTPLSGFRGKVGLLNRNGNIETRQTVAIMCWANKKQIENQYEPETITNYGQLNTRAKKVGFQQSLYSRISSIKAPPSELDSILIVFAVRRPIPVIGENTNIELLPYILNCQYDDEGSLLSNSPVIPVGLYDQCSPSLLKTMSGIQDEGNIGTVVQLGCGSLGSKITLHLARAGFESFHLIDSGLMAPHNNARHALVSKKMLPPAYKAELLESTLKEMGCDVKSDSKNIIEFIENRKNGKKVFPASTKLIIDSTASLSVRHALNTVATAKFPGRLLMTSIYSSGSLGLMALEGTKRNPRIDDLILYAHQLSVDGNKEARLLVNSEELSAQRTGQGCGTKTMVMTDARLSMHAAGMAEYIIRLMKEAFPISGALFLGVSDQSGLGISWHQWTQPKTTIIDSGDWTVRILPDANEAIKEHSKAGHPMETGGVLIGHISMYLHTFTVTHVLPAPSDSQFERTRFVLGTQALKNKIQKIQSSSKGLLSCIGTWHSHPSGGAASVIDHVTMQHLFNQRKSVPVLGLIRTPSGYRAVVKANEKHRNDKKLLKGVL